MISDKARTGSRLIFAAVAFAIFLSGLAIFQIRYGGPLYRKYALQDELVADILPPPAYVVEPCLEASQAMLHPEQAGLHLQDLAALEKDYQTRKAYWQTAPIPADQFQVLKESQTYADAFWSALDTRFAPAARSGDLETMRRIYDGELAPAYARQHEAILLARRFIERSIVQPLNQTARDMGRLAQGDHSFAAEGRERDDEIGIMTQQNAAMVQQSTNSTHHLSEEAEKLIRLVSLFRTRDWAQRRDGPTDMPSSRRQSDQERARSLADTGSGRRMRAVGDDWGDF